MAEIQSTAVEYRDIPGFPGYRVGDDGSVWSKLNGRWGYRQEWVELKSAPDSSGYPTVVLRDRVIKRSVGQRVCWLVLAAFVGPRPDHADACHYPDHNPANSRLENLRWGSRRENVEDARRHGRLVVGEASNLSKLNEALVLAIRAAYIPHCFGYKRIAAQFGYSEGTIYSIIKRKTWKHI